MLDEEAQRFKLTWEEKGGPIVKEPTRRSFGTQLIESSLARLVQGDARLLQMRAGVRVIAAMPAHDALEQFQVCQPAGVRQLAE